MFVCLDGTMGCGKTYYGANYIQNNYKKYYRVFTNINGFKFHDNIEDLKWSELLSYIEGAKGIYDQEDTGDQDIWDYLYSVGFLNSNIKDKIIPNLIVYDEAHNEFDKKSEILTWFITYHRHLFIDAYLITQTFSLIHYSYHKLFEFFIHGVPQSRQLFSSKFKYQRHIKTPFTDGKFSTNVGDEYLNKDDAIFNIYESGDKVRVKSSLKKYIYYAIGGVIVVFLFGVYLFKYALGGASEKINENKKVSSKILHSKPRITRGFISSIQGLKYIKVSCTSTQCINKKYKINLNLNDLEILLKNTNSQYLRAEKYSATYADLYLLVSSDFLELFKHGSEKNEKGFSLIN